MPQSSSPVSRFLSPVCHLEKMDLEFQRRSTYTALAEAKNFSGKVEISVMEPVDTQLRLRKQQQVRSRREFLSALALAAPALAAGGRFAGHAESPAWLSGGGPAQDTDNGHALLGQRFLTLATVVRVNQIEAARDKSIGEDERALHTPETVAAFREAFARGWPEGRLTWALSWLALKDESQSYRAIRQLVVEYHARFGDEVTFIPGGYFANAYSTREQVNRDLHDGLAMASAVVGNGYRPRCVIAGFLAAENLRFLAEHEHVHVCQGNIWSQYSVDNQDGDGSIVYPYYPSTEHFCKPAQGRDDCIDCVNLDGWTCDFLAARRAGFADGFNSRMGVGPIETVRKYGLREGLREMLHTTGIHFDQGFELNGFAWVTNIWEISIGPQGLAEWLSAVRSRWPQTRCITHGEFGLLWREHFQDNARLNYRFVERGSGIGGSDAQKEIRWYMNQKFRLALLRDSTRPGQGDVIDFTRYDLPAREPMDLTRKWSLLGEINQKQTRPQDAPVPLAELPAGDLARITAKYPELFRD